VALRAATPFVPVPPIPARHTVRFRFIDSATGYAIQPDAITLKAGGAAASASSSIAPASSQNGGRLTASLEEGVHAVTAAAANYRPMDASIQVQSDNPYTIRFLLDPIEPPAELDPANLLARHRPDSTLIQGFIVDEDSGAPLPGVSVVSQPGNQAAATDERGYFQIYLPAQTQAEADARPASLFFQKAGYQSQERDFLELWPDTDWTYRIRLVAGSGTTTVDERELRRRAKPEAEPTDTTATTSAPAPKSALTAAAEAALYDATPLTAPTNSTVRIPRNIRVLLKDGTNIDYVTLNTYCKHVLPSEWIAGWGSPTTYPGGSNCLSAGSIAVRCYAIKKINAASGTSTYDICATSSCQVYNPGTSSSYTDTAVNYTANYVVVTSAGAISSTEYSAENNSLANSCGDGFTEPSTTGPVCIYDPVCTGETRSGHGRGMCQWGSAKWASGRKFTGNSTGNSTLNGYPRRDWIWIVQHYYPTLTLVKAAPLLVGDNVNAMTAVNVNICPDGGITNGVNCTLLATLPTGTTGVIVDGPLQIFADGKGFTWYKVQWNDASSTLGWAKENYIERVFSLPGAPTTLSAAPLGTNQINLSWVNNSPGVEAGFKIERGPASSGPWLQIATVGVGTNVYSDKNLYGGSAWYYRVRAYNAGGNSSYSGVASATTTNAPPTITASGNRTITEGATLTVTNTAGAADFVRLITDFEAFATETANGVTVFRDPTNSTTTTGFLDATPDLAAITDVFPASGNPSARALRINCSFNAVAHPWLRLTTAGTAALPNPVIDFTKKLRFNIYTDKAIQIALGCRETTTAAGTAIGANGGTTGGIEWVGVTNISGTAPVPTRTIPAGAWTTVIFNLAAEPAMNFSGGNGILSTASGLGVLEHLAIVPAGGTGSYNIYIDNLAVIAPNALTFSLAPGAPANASINSASGILTWTPGESQGPATNLISVIATDSSVPARSATNSFTVVVVETNAGPVLAPIANFTVHSGMTVTFTNSATDSDFPQNTLTYSLDPGAPPAAALDSVSGVFRWLTSDAYIGAPSLITVRVTDGGAPPLSDSKTFSVTVAARPAAGVSALAGNTFAVGWSAIPGMSYRVQYKNHLDDAAWTTLADIIATGDTASVNDNSGGTQRFYRVLVLD
jgi:hypothetical protein